MIENFLNKLTSDNTENVDASFNNIIMTKVNTVLDIKRIELTSDIFNKQKRVTESADDFVSKGIFTQDGKKIEGMRSSKLFLCGVTKDDALVELSWKEYSNLKVKDTSSEFAQDKFYRILLKQVKQFNKQVDFNTWAKKGTPSFEDKVNYILGLDPNIKYSKSQGLKESLTESADDAYKCALEQEQSNPRFVEAQDIIAQGLTPDQAQAINNMITQWSITGENLQQLLRGFYQKVYVSGNNLANPRMHKALAFVLDKL